MYGEMIRLRRKKLKLRQFMLARKVGVSTNAVIKWEKEHAKPCAKHIARLQKELGIPNNELFDAVINE